MADSMCHKMFVAQHPSCSPTPFLQTNFDYVGWQKNLFALLKIQGNSYSCDIAEYEYGNQIALSPFQPVILCCTVCFNSGLHFV